MELRSKTLSSVSNHDYYSRKLKRFVKKTIMLTDIKLRIKGIVSIIKYMSYHFKYYWMYIDTCNTFDFYIKKIDILKSLSIMYEKTFVIQKEITLGSYDEIDYYTEKNFRKKCSTYRSLYEKKFESIFLEKVPLDVLRYILSFV